MNIDKIDVSKEVMDVSTIAAHAIVDNLSDKSAHHLTVMFPLVCSHLYKTAMRAVADVSFENKEQQSSLMSIIREIRLQTNKEVNSLDLEVS